MTIFYRPKITLLNVIKLSILLIRKGSHKWYVILFVLVVVWDMSMLFRQDHHMLLSSQKAKLEMYLIIYILKLNQWKNTKKVVDWFACIDEKPLYKYVQFDTTEFYPSIKEPLLEKALTFAEEKIDIPTDDKAIIKHAWKSFLFNKSET